MTETMYDPHEEHVITNQEEAEKSLAALAHWDKKEAEVTEHGTAQRDKADRYLQGELAKIERKQAWHRSALRAYLESQGKRKLSLTNGKVNLVSGRPKLKLIDTDAFIQWTQEAPNDERADYYETVIRPNKKRLMALFQQTGEVADGFEVEQPRDGVRVQLELDLPTHDAEQDDFLPED